MTTDYIDAMTRFEIPSNPFPGLRPFEFSESLLYFGRDGQSEQLLRKLSASRFLAVVGTSGSGKSSLVRAGLLPALFGGFMTSAGSEWRIALLRPGNDPIGNLAAALNASGLFASTDEQEAKIQATMTEATLRRSSLGLAEAVRQAHPGPEENVLVVADQFEELFRFAAVSESEQYRNDAAAFVKLLLEGAGQKEVPIYVVLTMRSDFLGDCSLFWDLPEAINEGQYLIPRLTREQRREAIAGPVAVCGASMTPRLINRLLNDMGDNQDQLPILQHALMRTWNNWKEENHESDPVDLHHYDAIGGMSAALSLHADEAFNELPDERSRVIAEKMFRGLTEKGDDNREIRRPMELKEICAITEASESEVIAIIEVFRREGRSFLMPPAGTRLDSDSLIDISHESLIRNWARLKDWVNQEAGCARTYRRLAETAVLYQKGEAGLWRDPDLQLALAWREYNKPNLAWARRYHPEFETAVTFLDESLEARDREAREREAQRRREIKRTRLTAIIFALAFLLSLAALLFANGKRVEANQSKQQMEAALEDANTQRSIAEKERGKAEQNAETARQESETARKARDDAKTQEQIAKDNEEKAEASAYEALKEKQNASEKEARAEAEAARSRQLLYAANINLAQEAYYDKNIQRAQELLEEDSAALADLRGFEWHYLRWLYDRVTGTLEVKDGIVNTVAFSTSDSENNILATVTDRSVKLWDASSQREIYSIPEQSNIIAAFALSPDGKRLATASDNNVKLWTVGSNQPPITLSGHTEPVTAIVFSPDGKRLITGSGDARTRKGNVKFWNMASHQELSPFPFVASHVSYMTISADGRMLAVASNRDSSEAEVNVFNISLVEPAIKFEFMNDVTSLALSPDGRILAVGNPFGLQFKLLDTRTKKEIATLDGFYPNVIAGPPMAIRQNAVAFSSDGSKIAAGSFFNLKLYDAAGLKQSKPPELIGSLIGQKEFVTSISFSPDGRSLATNDNATVKLWDATTSREYVTLKKQDGVVEQVIFSPDNKSASSIARKGSSSLTNLFDTASRQELALPNFQDKSLQAAYSPDGEFLATISRNGRDTLEMWDVGSRKLVATLTEQSNLRDAGGSDSIQSIAVSPDGKTVATVHLMAGRLALTGELNLKLWAMQSGREPAILKTNLITLISSVFSPDGRILACFGADNGGGVIQLWDVATHKVELLRTPEIRLVISISFSPDGRKIAVAGYSGPDTGNVELWDAISRKRIVRVAEGVSPQKLTFSPDGKTLAMMNHPAAATVMLWDIDWMKPKVALKGHTKRITAVAFSPDGKTIATGSEDHIVKLWNTSSLRLLTTLYNEESVTSIAFSSDNRMLVTGGVLGGVKLWPSASAAEEK